MPGRMSGSLMLLHQVGCLNHQVMVVVDSDGGKFDISPDVNVRLRPLHQPNATDASFLFRKVSLFGIPKARARRPFTTGFAVPKPRLNVSIAAIMS